MISNLQSKSRTVCYNLFNSHFGYFQILVFLLFVFIITIFLARSISLAQESLKIAAIVNDQVISFFDLESRLALLVQLSNIPNPQRARQQLGPLILRNLIDETIKNSEARRLKIDVTEEQLATRLEQFEREKRVPPGKLDDYLKNLGVDKVSLEEKLATELRWINVVSSTFGPTHQITDQEIDDVIADIQKNKGKPEFLVAEIFLAVGNAAQEGNIAVQGQRLLSDIQNGAPFQAIARNFSQSATAAVGGDLGWIRLNHIDTYTAQAITSLKPGQLSNLLKVPGGFKIIFLRNKRIISGMTRDKIASSIVKLHQIFFPISENAPDTYVASVKNMIIQKTKNLETCEAMGEVARNNNLPNSGPLGPISESKLSPVIRSLIEKLPNFKPSPPMLTRGGILVAMVCSRDQGKNLDSENQYRQTIRNKLFHKKLMQSSQKLIRDLRGNAFIDIR